uniref:TehB/YeaR-like domain-containing protein n=1 Tax=Aplanochytrium stocchinoi TaxID=215587 RepID=A0A7S3PJ62_9STRA|mmetsp:Transcript_1786/g.2691  ORF Transcript_1786/g.2691 Transcript_1786/m.2691 type:complete len:114 (+) Transcript_1786:228-569(+)|eukprot:CAMPEP_0204827814 /NCGR_PEP_ID=MMETSP1346-20131115/5305_1 /ASSEMBLY_ACC=CAM_ASM_000771 /TAXON_ID=215587 /ORGANISM="Aplanochytrium stocchinoi, Strain GSBS06" /LENGTH=113 /DNA_ID=CAMNT_0051956419 /DNA_START=137 /DNA_END=478 /DNA_ORIENTATION=+
MAWWKPIPKIRVVSGLEDLPTDVKAYKRLPKNAETFYNKDTLPMGLLSRHNTRAGVWGKLQVVEGELLYKVLESLVVDYFLDSSNYAVIQALLYHTIKPLTDDLQFPLTFFKK